MQEKRPLRVCFLAVVLSLAEINAQMSSTDSDRSCVDMTNMCIMNVRGHACTRVAHTAAVALPLGKQSQARKPGERSCEPPATLPLPRSRRGQAPETQGAPEPAVGAGSAARGGAAPQGGAAAEGASAAGRMRAAAQWGFQKRSERGARGGPLPNPGASARGSKQETKVGGEEGPGRQEGTE